MASDSLVPRPLSFMRTERKVEAYRLAITHSSLKYTRRWLWHNRAIKKRFAYQRDERESLYKPTLNLLLITLRNRSFCHRNSKQNKSDLFAAFLSAAVDSDTLEKVFCSASRKPSITSFNPIKFILLLIDKHSRASCGRQITFPLEVAKPESRHETDQTRLNNFSWTRNQRVFFEQGGALFFWLDCAITCDSNEKHEWIRAS